MTRLRFWAVASLALVLAGNSTKAENRDVTFFSGLKPTGEATEPANDRACVIYSLGEMGIDADLGQWVADTIPEVIEPGSWKESGAIRYYAPKNILVVRQSTAVHTKVDGFLKNLKAVRPPEKITKKATRGAVVPADYRTPGVLRTSTPLPDQSGYPVPAPVKTPKHLFHFLIRYEGEGIIDDNVVKFMKIQARGEKKETPSVAPQATGASPTVGYSSGGAPTGSLAAPTAAPAPSTLPNTTSAPYGYPSAGASSNPMTSFGSSAPLSSEAPSSPARPLSPSGETITPAAPSSGVRNTPAAPTKETGDKKSEKKAEKKADPEP